jgi:hypothetical protein
LGAGLLHASINSAGAMAVVPGGWQHIPALIVLTLVVAVVRSRRGLSVTDGGAPSLLPAGATDLVRPPDTVELLPPARPVPEHPITRS